MLTETYTPKSKEIKVFKDGHLQQNEWENHNCARCAKRWEKNPRGGCDIEAALMVAYFLYGKVEREIAFRMGYDKFKYIWDCPEFELDSDIGKEDLEETK